MLTLLVASAGAASAPAADNVISTAAHVAIGAKLIFANSTFAKCIFAGFIFASFIFARVMAALVMETYLGRLFTERSPLGFKTNRRDFNSNLGQFSGRFQAA